MPGRIRRPNSGARRQSADADGREGDECPTQSLQCRVLSAFTRDLDMARVLRRSMEEATRGSREYRLTAGQVERGRRRLQRSRLGRLANMATA